ncbi:hypothetical protein H0H92_015532 [Tricholoma furcatifolium]|nr:hypothetical protein H0H92_015532 [Tricholoma furcatifolium]
MNEEQFQIVASQTGDTACHVLRRWTDYDELFEQNRLSTNHPRPGGDTLAKFVQWDDIFPLPFPPDIESQNEKFTYTILCLPPLVNTIDGFKSSKSKPVELDIEPVYAVIDLIWKIDQLARHHDKWECRENGYRLLCGSDPYISGWSWRHIWDDAVRRTKNLDFRQQYHAPLRDDDDYDYVYDGWFYRYNRFILERFKPWIEENDSGSYALAKKASVTDGRASHSAKTRKQEDEYASSDRDSDEGNEGDDGEYDDGGEYDEDEEDSDEEYGMKCQEDDDVNPGDGVEESEMDIDANDTAMDIDAEAELCAAQFKLLTCRTLNVTLDLCYATVDHSPLPNSYQCNPSHATEKMSTALTIRQIVVDDSDPNIQYAGGISSWTTDTTGLNGLGSYGPIYNGTSHGATTFLSLSYQFTGTAISAFGTNQQTLYPNNTYFPTCECLVDQVSYTQTVPSLVLENNWNLCNIVNLSPNNHTLTIRAQSYGQTWWFDYLRYTPLPTLSFSSGETAEIYVKSNDTGIKYGGVWNSVPGFNSVDQAMSTQMPQANMVLTFVGTKVAWYGWINLTASNTPSTASYTVDGSSPTSFNLTMMSGALIQPNTLLFTTPDLLFETHQLVVTYTGGDGDTPMPLTLGYLILRGTSVTSLNVTAVSSPSPSNSGSPTATHTVPIGTIVGSLLGGLSVIALALLVLWWWRRRRLASYNQQSVLTDAPVEPFVSQPASWTSDEVMPSVSPLTAPPPYGWSRMSLSATATTNRRNSWAVSQRNPAWEELGERIPLVAVHKRRLDA